MRDVLDELLTVWRAGETAGVAVKSDQWAIDLAHSTCDVLNKGGTVNDALSMLTKTTKWSVQKSTDFGGIAVYVYCRDKFPASTGG